MKLSELFTQLNDHLKNEPESEQFIEWALFELTGKDIKRSEWQTLLNFEIPEVLAHQALSLAQERELEGTPLQYLTRTQWFYGRKFFVEKGVLVPRPETEILVDTILTRLKKLSTKTLTGFELGVGAGPIAVTLLAEEPFLSMIASDISPIAFEIASINARTHLANPSRLTLQLPDLIKNETFDFIVSNPPYLKLNSEEVEPPVARHEPKEALFAPESDVLYFYKFLESLSQNALNKNGFLALEIPHERVDEISRLFDQRIWREPGIILDLNSRPRVLVLELK